MVIGGKLESAMILLIDGYNILKQMIGRAEVSETEKRAFIAQLRYYSQKKQHTIVLIFDGGSMGFPVQEIQQGVTLIQSGFKQSADDIIKIYLKKNSGKSGLLLVSSDRELRDAAKALRIESMPALEFFTLLQESTAKKPYQSSTHKQDTTLYKISEQSNPELDKLMMESTGRIPQKDNEHNAVQKVRSPHTLSKEERRQAALRKKL